MKQFIFFTHITQDLSEKSVSLFLNLPTHLSLTKTALCINLFFKRLERRYKLEAVDILVRPCLISRIVALGYQSVADCWGFPGMSLHVGSNSDRRKSKQELAIEM